MTGRNRRKTALPSTDPEAILESATFKAVAGTLISHGGGETHPELVHMDVYHALYLGPDAYARRLATDREAHDRFNETMGALTGRPGRVHEDPVTIGAVTWTYQLGQGFSDMVREAQGGKP